MVTSATFRHPGPLAISVAQVDEMSGGRVDLGIGAGWFEAEHAAYAIPFPPLGERFERLTEQLDILTGLWTTPGGETFDYAGTHYTVNDSPALPKPVQTAASTDHHRRPRRQADAGAGGPVRREFNVPFSSRWRPSRRSSTGWPRQSQAAGRPADSMTYSACFVVCAGRDDAEVARRADAIGREVDELRGNSPLVGTPAEIVDKLAAFTEAGVQRVYLQMLDMADLDHLDLFASEVARQSQ